ncbi:MAG: hypothetical protein IT210_03940 [Armatimonadetes bacterium]|nr:hypothetical protein [Armatimonadota bacterium]
MRPDSFSSKTPPKIHEHLRRIGRWMASAPVPAAHPDGASLARYLGWLLDGAAGPCPEPGVGEHIGECPTCYRMAGALHLASRAAEREAASEAVALTLSLAKRLGRSAIAWLSITGETVRVPFQSRQQSAPAMMEMPYMFLSDASMSLPAEEADSISVLRLSLPEAVLRRPPDEEARLDIGPWQVRCSAWMEETGGRRVRVEVRGPDGPRPADGVTVRLQDGRGKLRAEGRTEAGMVTFSELPARTYRVEICPP